MGLLLAVVWWGLLAIALRRAITLGLAIPLRLAIALWRAIAWRWAIVLRLAVASICHPLGSIPLLLAITTVHGLLLLAITWLLAIAAG